MSTRHLNQVQLAARWNISPRTLERWRWIGEGPPYLKIGGRVVYRFEDVERYEQEQLRLSEPGGQLSASHGTGARGRTA
jgi:predicted site-specific integrase-resolvase